MGVSTRWLAAAALVVAQGVQAQTPFVVDPTQEVVLTPEINDVDLAFDGKPFHALLLLNDVASAHNTKSVEFFTPDSRRVYFEPGKGASPPSEYPSIHSPSVSTIEGADYTLQSVRFLLDSRARRSFILVASRDFGGSYVDSRPVTFELFKFSRNLSQDPGDPPAEFTLIRWSRTTKCYPDANFALTQELGLAVPEGRDKGMSQPCSHSRGVSQ